MSAAVGPNSGVLSVAERDVDGAAVLTVTGEVDLATAPTLCARLDAACRRALRPRLLVDLSDVGFCDSTGLRALVCAVDEVRIRRGRIVIVTPSDAGARHVFELVGGTELLPLVDDRAAGLKRLLG